MFQWIKNNWFTILLIAILIIAIGYLVPHYDRGNTVTIHDTTIVTKLQIVTQQDTVIKWYERVVYRDTKPDTIYWSKVDTAFILKYKDHDVIISLKKVNCDLDIFALNEQGMILKEYKYKNVCGDFSVTSQTDNVFIKSSIWDWNRISLYAEHSSNLLWQNHSFEGGLSTGITFQGRVSGDVSLDYNTIKGLEVKQKLSVIF